MNFTYTFSAKTYDKNGRESLHPVTGLITAQSLDLAFYKIKRNGFLKPFVRLNIIQTINTWFGAQINQKELSRFYRTIGVRLGNNGTPIDAISAGQDFVTDKRLISAIAVFRSTIEQGEHLHTAMKIAGFDERHCMTVKAMSEGAEQPKAFIDLSKEIADQDRLKNMISGMMRMLNMTVIGFYLFIPALIFIMAPKMISFFEKAGKDNLKIPEYVTVFYDFVTAANKFPPLFIVPYIIIPVGAFFFLKSKLLRNLLDRIALLRNFSLYQEHSQIWSIYGLLHRAGVRPDEIMDMVAKTVKRDETRNSILIFSKRIKAGNDEINAMQVAQFPKFVSSTFIAAKNSGSPAQELINFSNNLKEDLELMSLKIKDLIEIASKFMLGLIVLIVFMLVLYPVMGPIIASL